MSAVRNDESPLKDRRLRDWWSLLKPRVMSLAIFTALVGLIAAPGALHPAEVLASVACIAAGAGGAGALNQWYDADIDARMRRTRSRAVPSGRISPVAALAFGLGLSAGAAAALALVANPSAGALLALTIVFYVVVYTMWLKRSTPRNIVIGGAAGALPPLIGWVAATGGVAPEPLLMTLVILLWTPAHFWALALFTQDDYAAAGVPMLPLTHGEAATRRGVLVYAALTALSALALAFSAIGGPATLVAALLANALLLRRCARLIGRTQRAAKADRHAAEKRVFGASIFYLLALFSAVALDVALGGPPAGWPALF